MTIDEESYWNGRLGKGIMGGSPADYERGLRDASNTQGGMHPFLLFVLLFLLWPTIIATFLASLVIALIIKIFINRKTKDKVVASFGKLLSILFIVIFLWQVIASVFMVLFYLLLVNNIEIPGLSFIITEKNLSSVIVVLLIICQFLAALIAGFMVKRKFSSHPSFEGIKGYLLSVFILVCFVLPVVIISNYAIVKIAGRYFLPYQ